MKNIRIQKGVNIPLKGRVIPTEDYETLPCRQVALIGRDYIGMKPTFFVEPGSRVKKGELLFTDKKSPKVKYTSPATGTVIAINRGARRVFESIVIEISDEDPVVFKDISSDSSEKVKEALLESGMWPLLRERPFGKTANPDILPEGIFITAIDTNPLAPATDALLKGREDYYIKGIEIVSKLTEGKTYICVSGKENLKNPESGNIETVAFQGPHPAGNPGTHIHFLNPVTREKPVWHIGAQEVADIGEFFDTGIIPHQKVIAIAGTGALKPSYYITRTGASVEEIIEGRVNEGKIRRISGSPLSGFEASGTSAYIGRYHNQLTLLPEGGKRDFIGWLSPGFKLHSVKKTVASALFPSKLFNLTTDLNGGERAIVPIGSYEKVMPLDILPTFLLRSICAQDIEEAEKLGVLELVEEDLALCSYVCPSKIDFQTILRENLNIIEKEG